MRRLASAGGVVGIIGALLLLAAPAESSRHMALGSTRDWAYALAIQRDGKVVAAGLSRQRSGSFALARYSGRGALDKRFGTNGKLLTRLGFYGAYALAIERDGKLVAGGDGGLVRYRATGKLDPGFGRGGIRAGFYATGIAFQNDGKIIAIAASHTHSALARFTVRGSLDPTFGRAGKVAASFGAAAVAIQTDGKIVAVGSSFDGHRNRFALARYSSDGELDSHFGKAGKVTTAIESSNMAFSAAIQLDGKIVVAGTAGGSADFALARYKPDGTLDAGFGDAGTVLTNFGADPTASSEGSADGASAVAIQADGKIVAAGSSDAKCDAIGHSCKDFALARYSTDGDLDQSFGRAGKVLTHFVGQAHKPSSSLGEAVAIQRDGKIVVAGLGTGYDFALARYSTDGDLDQSFGRGGQVLTDFGSG